MSDFLEKLKNDMQEAHVRFQAAQQKFTAAQAEAQAAQQRLAAAQSEFGLAAAEFQAHQTLINMHTRNEQVAVAHTAPAAFSVNGNGTSKTDDNKSEGNKTETVRVLLRQHPAGMTPSDIWKEMESQMTNRAYLYSVLKRLKDKGEARERRGKYFSNPKIEESQSQIVQ